MRLIVFADSHAAVNDMLAAIETEHPDMILHLGDLSRDAEQLGYVLPQIPLLAVCGNCDRDSDFPDERVFTLEGVRIYICHGHKLGVKFGLLRAKLAAQQVKANILLFGHTHVPFLDETDGLKIMNPGACGGFGSHTYGMITLRDGRADCEIRKITGKEMEL